MQADLIFDSRDNFFRDPFGAVEEGTEIHFKIVLPRFMKCTSATLKITSDDESVNDSFSMFWCKMRDNDHEVWECHYTPKESGLFWYFFEIDTGLGKKNVTKIWGSSRGNISDGASWQLTVYEKDFITPDWLSGGIMYQIFPDRFYCSGQKKSDVPDDRIMQEDWNAKPSWRPDKSGKITNSEYFCGDIYGIIEKLDYLKDLGVTCIYLNPIFEAHSNHRYNTADFTKVDPLLGTNKDFQELCYQLKKRSIHLILDGVFSHTGSDSIYFNKNKRYHNEGAYNSKTSEYSDWFKFSNWPDEYESWWGISTLPNVSETNEGYNEYINGKNGITRTWIRYGANGWRLDVADELPDVFIENLRKAIKEENPEAMILGEVWEDASNKISYGKRRKYVFGNELDNIMNYPFRNAIIGFLTGSDASKMMEIILDILENYPPQIIKHLMNPIGTHDTDRAITILAGDPISKFDKEKQSKTTLSHNQKKLGIKLMKVASAMQYTLPGVPCIYYGDEAGVEGYSDPLNRKTFPWGNENQELISWYKKLAHLRKSCPALKDGKFIEIKTDSPNLMAYVRGDNTSSLLCLFNSGDEDIMFNTPSAFLEGTAILGTICEKDQIRVKARGCSFILYGVELVPDYNELMPISINLDAKLL